MSFAITDLLLNTGVFKIPAIVRLYQIQTPLRESQGTVRRGDGGYCPAVSQGGAVGGVHQDA